MKKNFPALLKAGIWDAYAARYQNDMEIARKSDALQVVGKAKVAVLLLVLACVLPVFIPSPIAPLALLVAGVVNAVQAYRIARKPTVFAPTLNIWGLPVDFANIPNPSEDVKTCIDLIKSYMQRGYAPTGEIFSEEVANKAMTVMSIAAIDSLDYELAQQAYAGELEYWNNPLDNYQLLSEAAKRALATEQDV